MKKFASVTGLALLGLSLLSSAAQAGDLQVEVQGLNEIKGDVMVAVFNQKGQWLKQALHSKKVGASQLSLTVQFENLPDGDYAVSVFHDLNSNGRLDSNVIGIPTEPYGFSNDAAGNFGPPSFDAAKVTLTQDKKVISVRLN